MSGAVQSVVTVAGRAGVAALALALVLHGSTKRPPVHKVAASAPASARELTDDDFARGFVVCRVGMGEAHDFSPPPNAVAVADWRAFGAAEDWVYLDLASRGWSYRVGANRATRLRVHSSGRVEPLVSGGGATLVPVCATLGIVPEANWGRLPESARPSGVWYALTPSNTLQLTWRNALVGRRADAPATFQCELWPDGRADFRYDLSRIPMGTADGLRASVSLGGGSWSAAVPRDGALSLRPLDPVDRDNPDCDGDGLPAVDEVIAYGTDPGCADTDLDGLWDPDELAAGTDPRTPDTDGDGLSDGEEVALGTDPLAADGDGDGLSDFDEVCVHGTDPLRVDTDGDGLPDAEEIARGTSPLAADTDGDGLDDAREFLVGTDPLVADTDGDGAPDGWELENESDPLVMDTDGDGLSDGLERAVGSSPTLIDTDGDGLGDFEEFSSTGTSPARADTDGDGLSDSDEFVLGTDPLVADPDGDGLSDGDECATGTDPLRSDTDGDGLLDGAEVAAGASPLKPDTDGDGLPDVWEARFGLRPDAAWDATMDSDGDGLSNLREFAIGTSPILADTDGDGLSDGDECGRGTSPLRADTDGDGLDDGREVRFGMSPVRTDTDGDSLPDGWEVLHRLNPLDATGADGASGDPDGDGLSNGVEYVLGTDPRCADTDGDGVDDGEEAGCFRVRYGEAESWASAADGWEPVPVETDEGWPACLFLFEDILYIGEAYAYDVICQWNGLILVNAAGHDLSTGLVESRPSDLSGPLVSTAALAIAPCWTTGATNAAAPSVSVFRRQSGSDVRYAIRYEGLAAVGTNTVSFQTTLTFVDGVYRGTEMSYGPDAPGVLHGGPGEVLSVGLQDTVAGRRWLAAYGRMVQLSGTRTFEFLAGMGTDPTVDESAVDTDGDGLPDELERALGTSPGLADTDGDGMGDGWERDHGFDPTVANGEDGDPSKDADADPDRDGLTNAEESAWGTDPTAADTDGDGVSDGEEVGWASDPADASDGGRPASCVPVAFHFGDPSGSDSEKYRLVVRPTRGPEGESPDEGSVHSFVWENAQFGECDTRTAALRRGWTYEVRLFHVGTRLEYGPDYDYHLTCTPPPCVGVVTNDPQRLFGESGNGGETFEADGREAEIVVLDGVLVGDYDRRDGFTDGDLADAYRGRPVRHWVNDDDDGGDVSEGEDDVPGCREPYLIESAGGLVGIVGRVPDYYNSRVDGRGDILDFTPVWIGMGRALRQIASSLGDMKPSDLSLTLSQPEGAVNIVWTSLATNDVGRFLTEDVAGCGENLDERLAEAETVRLTDREVRLPDAFVDRMVENPACGIVLMEGRGLEEGDYRRVKNLVLRCYRRPFTPGDGNHLLELRLPVVTSPVEEMFRWIDYRQLFGVSDGLPTRLGSPWNRPDGMCGDTHYVFVHGYNVGVQSARGWAAEMFKRLVQSGSRAMFTAVDWYGNDSQVTRPLPFIGGESPDYYVNVEHAFGTAAALARDCASLPGRKIVLAHSLGNVLASSAAKDFGLGYGRYYMLNAAVPVEAYDPTVISGAMVDADWRSLPDRMYAASWWRLFGPADGRRTLTWRGRFAGIANAINCYSPTEDTLGNVSSNHGVVARLWRGNFWAAQELNKGTRKLESLPGDWGNVEGGWGFSPDLGVLDVVMGHPTQRLIERIAGMSNEDLIRHPIFHPFDEAWLRDPSAIGDLASIRDRILADGVPATSYAAGSNPIENGRVSDNINYMDYLKNGCPLKEVQWRHSDIKAYAYYYVWKFFHEIIKREEGKSDE